MLRQLGPEVLLDKLELDVPEGQLPVLPVERDHLEEDDSEGVDVCVLAGLENHTVSVPEVLHRSVKRLVGVASDQGKVFLHGISRIWAIRNPESRGKFRKIRSTVGSGVCEKEFYRARPK